MLRELVIRVETAWIRKHPQPRRPDPLDLTSYSRFRTGETSPVGAEPEYGDPAR